MDWIFDTTSFVTRNHCGMWSDWLIKINQGANLLIFIAYTTIPISLFLLWRIMRKRKSVRQEINKNVWVIFMFAVFTLSCGLTHLMDVFAFTWAPYRFFTLIDCVTATASILTAIVLPNSIKKIYKASIEDKG